MSFYLEKIRKNYYFRLRVPADLVPYLDCKCLRKTLKTSNRDNARTLARTMLYASEQLFTQIRSGLMSEEQILELVRQYKQNVLDGYTARRRKQGIKAYLPRELQNQEMPLQEAKAEIIRLANSRRQDLFDLIQTNQFDSVAALARQMLVEAGTKKPTKKDQDLLCEFLLKSQLEINSIIIDRMRDNYNNPHDNFRERLNASAAPVATSKLPSAKLSELWDAFRHSKLKTKAWRAATQEKNEDAFKVIVDILGDIKVAEFEDDKPCLKLLEHIQVYPKNKNLIFPGKPYSPALQKHAKYQPMSAAHANFHMQLLSSVLRYGMKGNKWGLTVNHAEGLEVEDKRKVSELTAEFTKDDIENMFRGLTKTHMVNHPERYWLPLLALYTGARSDELCQLRIADISEEEGIPVINIKHSPELLQHTKNEQDRVVPIHPHLVQLGFLDYVQKVRQNKKQDRLWQALKYYRSKWNVLYGKHFSGTFCKKYIGKSGEGKKSFHSLRHTYINWYKQHALGNNGLENLLRLKSLIGHLENSDLQFAGMDSDITLNRYGKKFPIKGQYELICKLDYGVDLGLLKMKYT